MLGTGDAGLVEVLDVPEHLRDVVPEGLAALSFMADDFAAVRARAGTFADDVTMLDTGCRVWTCSSARWAGCPSSSWEPMSRNRTPVSATRRTPECVAATPDAALHLFFRVAPRARPDR